MINREYPAKLLLFGEYTVLNGERALSVPFDRFGARWVYNNIGEPDPRLLDYATFLAKDNYNSILDVDGFVNEVRRGLVLESQIRAGYGLGSSGSLVAAIFDRFRRDGSIDTGNFEVLKEAFANLEEYFHGRSSGLDPLISYTRSAFVSELGMLRPVSLPQNDGIGIFLIDSGMERHTQKLVEQYKTWQRKKDFTESCIRPLMMYNEHAIGFFLQSQTDLFWEHLSMLSAIQREYFTPMIPGEIQKAWDLAGRSENIRVKLCGAGGGGYFLGFCRGDVGSVARTLGVPVLEVSLT